MGTKENLKNDIIDRLLLIEDKNVLEEVYNILESTQKGNKISLTSEQIEMLEMSEKDIKNGKIISEEELGTD